VIAFAGRYTRKPFELGGYRLPVGTRILIAACLTHYDPQLFASPDRFDPDRFLDTLPDTYAWIPFGGGIRRCLGAAFAQFEMEVVLKELVLRRTLAPSRPESERNYRRAITETPRHDAEVLIGRVPTPTACPAAHAPESKPQIEVEAEAEVVPA